MPSCSLPIPGFAGHLGRVGGADLDQDRIKFDRVALAVAPVSPTAEGNQVRRWLSLAQPAANRHPAAGPRFRSPGQAGFGRAGQQHGLPRRGDYDSRRLVTPPAESRAMFPIGDDNSQRRTLPVVTYVLIGLNVLMFLLELSAGDDFIQRWAFIPAAFAADPAGNVITIFTAMFMHGGWLHLLGNMLFLWIFGDNVEDRLGHAKFLVFYLLAGTAGTLAQFALAPHSSVPNVGASGAIAGARRRLFLMFPQSRATFCSGASDRGNACCDRARHVDRAGNR